jgi:hypothetical protein
MEFFKPLGEYIQAPQQKTPEQRQQDALIEALRGMGGQQQVAAPMQAGNVVNANGGQGALQSGVELGQNLGQIGTGLNNKFNFGTALQYGTTPGSQQTAMLAAQNAGF